MYKNASSALFIISTMLAIYCSGPAGTGTEKGFIDPGDLVAKTDISTNKSYSVGGQSCVPAGTDKCNAVIHISNGTVGIAVNDRHLGVGDFNLKLHWQSDSIPTSVSNLPSTSYTIKVIKTGTLYSTTSDPMNLTIADQGDGTYLITFTTNNIDLGGFTINIGDTIRAYKY